ncbi:MAG: RsmD family RNA methyltransferase [Bacteroidales bacterium]|nr:RsmD family RNA methyltransferase [Bacteroidales bacterium]
MRIIGGKNRGRRIQAPPGLPVRPTTDMAKEALFNILRFNVHFEEVDTLDLFSGIGSISYEFASRGARSVTSVDNHPGCVHFISQTAQQLDYRNLFVIRAHVIPFLRSSGRSWDIIFADPPYDYPDTPLIPGIIFERMLLREEGWLIIEHDKATRFEDSHVPAQTRHYGKAYFSFFRR